MILYETSISDLSVLLVDKLDDHIFEWGKLVFTLNGGIKCTGVSCDDCPLPSCADSVPDLLDALNISPDTYPEYFI